MEFERYQLHHLDGVLGLCSAEGWDSYTADPGRTHKALTAAGVTTTVALDDGQVCGFAQVQSDGEIQAHLSLLAVRKDCRRQGIGKKLIAHAFGDAGGKRLDLVTDEAQEFYLSMAHSAKLGFRIYPDTD